MEDITNVDRRREKCQNNLVTHDAAIFSRKEKRTNILGTHYVLYIVRIFCLQNIHMESNVKKLGLFPLLQVRKLKHREVR